MKKTYAEIPREISMGNHSWTDRELIAVETRDPTKFQAPDGCTMYRFFDREEVVSDSELLTGEPKNYSGWYYFGRAMTIDEAKKLFPNAIDSLRSKIERGEYRLVKTRKGIYELKNLDTIIAEK